MAKGKDIRVTVILDTEIQQTNAHPKHQAIKITERKANSSLIDNKSKTFWSKTKSKNVHVAGKYVIYRRTKRWLTDDKPI